MNTLSSMSQAQVTISSKLYDDLQGLCRAVLLCQTCLLDVRAELKTLRSADGVNGENYGALQHKTKAVLVAQDHLRPELKKPLIEDLTPQNAHAITFADHHRAILRSFDAFFMAYGKIPNLEPLAVAERDVYRECGVLLSHCLLHMKKESPAERELPIEMWHMIFTELKEMGASNAQLASWRRICRRAEKGIQLLPWECIDATEGHWKYSSETVNSVGWKQLEAAVRTMTFIPFDTAISTATPDPAAAIHTLSLPASDQFEVLDTCARRIPNITSLRIAHSTSSARLDSIFRPFKDHQNLLHFHLELLRVPDGTSEEETTPSHSQMVPFVNSPVSHVTIKLDHGYDKSTVRAAFMVWPKLKSLTLSGNMEFTLGLPSIVSTHLTTLYLSSLGARTFDSHQPMFLHEILSCVPALQTLTILRIEYGQPGHVSSREARIQVSDKQIPTSLKAVRGPPILITTFLPFRRLERVHIRDDDMWHWIDPMSETPYVRFVHHTLPAVQDIDILVIELMYKAEENMKLLCDVLGAFKGKRLIIAGVWHEQAFLLVCQIISQVRIDAERLDFAMLSVQCRDDAHHHHFWSDEMVKNLFTQLTVNAAMHPRLDVVGVERSGDYGGLQWRRTVWSSLSGAAKSGWVLNTRNDITWQGWTAWSPFEPCLPCYSSHLCPFDQGPRRF